MVRAGRFLANGRATRAAPVDEIRGLLNSVGYSQGGTAKFRAAPFEWPVTFSAHSLHTWGREKLGNTQSGDPGLLMPDQSPYGGTAPGFR